jgi:type I restriction enzyme, S subunit
MLGSWRTVTVKELIEEGVIIGHKDGNHGSLYPKSTEFGDEGVPFLTAKSIINNVFNLKDAPRLNWERASKMKIGYIEEGDVLLSHNATVGRVIVVPPLDGKVLIGTSLTFFRFDKTKIIPGYLAAYFNSRPFQNELAASMSQTTRNQVPITAQRRLRIILPSITEQKAIAHILGKLNDKIELNRQMNQTLESIAQALFKSWFVDFNPVLDKSLATGNELPEALHAMAKKRQLVPNAKKLLHANPTLATKFPSAFVFSEILDQWIPEGWEVKKLGDVAVFGNGKTSPDRDEYGTFPVFGSNGEIGRSNESNREDIIVVGRVGTYCGSLYYVKHKCWVTDNAMFTQMRNSKYNLFFYEFLRHCNLNNMSTGSGQPLLNQSILKAINIVVPTEIILELYSEQAYDLEIKSYSNQQQTETLTQLRDTLLPQLISGKVRVPEEMIMNTK